MKKSDWPTAFDRLKPFFEDAARTHYKEGDLERGFKFWSVSEVLTETDLSDDQIKEALSLDGGGDLDLDGYFEDAEEGELTLVQSRYHGSATAVGNDQLSKFLGLLEKILNPAVVVESKNPLIQDAHRAVRDAIQRGWGLRFIFVTSGYLTPEGRTFADSNITTESSIDGVKIQRELDVFDVERLLELWQSHLTPGSFSTDVSLAIPISERVSSKIAKFKVLVAPIRASELVKAFKTHGYRLFELNPRGKLQNKINAEMLRTLKDENRRKLFFHLNNGVTAVCDGFKDSDSEVVEVRDFQIVNGCQTTVTLNRAGAIVEADDDIKVLLRIVEGLHGLGDDVATATNTQARLTAQDFKSNDPRQKSLKKEFDALPAPVLYEIKRGDWEMEQNKARYLDKATKTNRRIKMKDIAQATLAFLGEPGDAKDRSRDIFQSAQTYALVFPQGVRAQQLLLPWDIYKEAERLCSEWTQFSGANYARFCLVAIVGEDFAPNHKLPAVHECSKLRSQPEVITEALKRGQTAIVSAISGLDEYPGHREFFRSSDFFGKVLRTYKALPKS